MHMNVVERPSRAPSRCMLCHRTDGPMIETGLQERLPFGQVYICLTSCVPTMIELSGGLTKHAAEELLRSRGELRGRLELAEGEIQRLLPFERAIVGARQSMGVEAA